MQTSQQFDPFVVLSVEKNTSIKDIKKQYLKLVKQLHPDKYRNKGQRAFEEAQQHMINITRAYQILTDPNERSKYDQSQISTFTDMRSSFQKFDRHNTPQAKLPVKASFGQSELKDFNSMFEQQRRRDPNDRGYEDELDMAPRMSFNEAKHGYQSTASISENPSLLKLKGKNFDPKRFNELFEQNLTTKSSELIEKPVDNPLGFSLMGSTSFTEVSLYDGKMVVGSDMDDFSSYDSGSMMYTDYRKGYTESALINQCGQYEDDGLPLERKVQMRENEMFDQDGTKLSGSEWKRQADHKFEMEKQRHIEQERENQKKIVIKYHDQYQDYLPSADYQNKSPQSHQQPLPQIQAQGPQIQQQIQPQQQMYGGAKLNNKQYQQPQYYQQPQQLQQPQYQPIQQLPYQQQMPQQLQQQIPYQQIPQQLQQIPYQQTPQQQHQQIPYQQIVQKQTQQNHIQQIPSQPPNKYHSQIPMQQIPMQQMPMQQMPMQQMPMQQMPMQQMPTQQMPTQQIPMQQLQHAPSHLQRQVSPQEFIHPQNSRQFESDDSGYNSRFVEDTREPRDPRYMDEPNSLAGTSTSDRRSGRSYNDFMMDRMHNIHKK